MTLAGIEVINKETLFVKHFIGLSLLLSAVNVMAATLGASLQTLLILNIALAFSLSFTLALFLYSIKRLFGICIQSDMVIMDLVKEVVRDEAK